MILAGLTITPLAFVPKNILMALAIELLWWLRMALLLGGPMLAVYGIRQLWGERVARRTVVVLVGALLAVLGAAVFSSPFVFDVGLVSLLLGGPAILFLVGLYAWWLRRGAPIDL